MLLKVPLSAEFLVAQLALNFLLHSALMVHVTQHDASCRIPFSTLEALIVLTVLSLKQLRREEVIDAKHPMPQT
jgi:hypothetical protein